MLPSLKSLISYETDSTDSAFPKVYRIDLLEEQINRNPWYELSFTVSREY
jgi:hypothetical protein